LFIMEEIHARGHVNIKATHKTTMEITRDRDLTLRGDCIIGVDADKSAVDLDRDFKEAIKRDDTILIILLKTPSTQDIVLAMGSRNLILSDERRVIIRKSNYIEAATIGVKANKSAGDLNRDLVNELKNPDIELVVKLYALPLKTLLGI